MISPESEALWEKLAATAFQEKRLHIAERCYAAVGDVARAGALKRVRNLANRRYAIWSDPFYPDQVLLGAPRSYELSAWVKF